MFVHSFNIYEKVAKQSEGSSPTGWRVSWSLRSGVYQALYEIFTKKNNENNDAGKPFLDIVAGTSIGAINAAIIVSYFLENNTWEGSPERLNEFWEYLSKESSLDKIPGFTYWWDYMNKNVSRNIASGEAARRYYSAKEFSIQGVPAVFLPFNTAPGYKVF